MKPHDHRHTETSTDRLQPDAPDIVTPPVRERCLVSTTWRGVTLTHHGNDIGVITHVTRRSVPGVAVLHALGGVSGALVYAVPETAIVRVFGVSSRAVVSNDVEFEPRHLCANGRVILTPRASPAVTGPVEPDWLNAPHGICAGVREYADDGFLGIVEATLSMTRPGMVDLLIVRVQMPFRKKRLPVIPVTRLVAFTPADKVARVTGTRSELAGMDERRPHAC